MKKKTKIGGSVVRIRKETTPVLRTYQRKGLKQGDRSILTTFIKREVLPWRRAAKMIKTL